MKITLVILIALVAALANASLASVTLAKKSASRDVVFTCDSITAPNAQNQLTIPVAYEVKKLSGSKFSATSTFLGLRSTTSNVIYAETTADLAELNDIVATAAPGIDISSVTKQILIQLPKGTANDAPVKLVDLQDADGLSIVKLVEISAGLLGHCTSDALISPARERENYHQEVN